MCNNTINISFLIDNFKKKKKKKKWIKNKSYAVDRQGLAQIYDRQI